MHLSRLSQDMFIKNTVLICIDNAQEPINILLGKIKGGRWLWQHRNR